ncbi:MAG: transposase [Okeania sp. SIO2G4]|nr:transposase [Okeania sp. SIO2H7]NEP75832.1 transposase [Okeania sp. SIO2G5]NEP97379.1 transposase [Okeania sp. SIO2F5]NEQ95107.1 transposase [Okeania sp. SIO2G4]
MRYDGKKSLPLDIELYQHSSYLAQGKDDKLFQKKPSIGIELIDRSLSRGHSQEKVLIDAGYGNNTRFMNQLEEKE